MLYEKDDAIVTRCSLTVLITPTQTVVVTKSVMPAIKCTKELKDEGVKGLLAMSMDKKKKRKNKKKKAGEADAADADGDNDDEMES